MKNTEEKVPSVNDCQMDDWIRLTNGKLFQFAGRLKSKKHSQYMAVRINEKTYRAFPVTMFKEIVSEDDIEKGFTFKATCNKCGHADEYLFSFDEDFNVKIRCKKCGNAGDLQPIFYDDGEGNTDPDATIILDAEIPSKDGDLES